MKTFSQFALLFLLPFTLMSGSAADVVQAGSSNGSVTTAASGNTGGAFHEQTASEIVRMQEAGVEKPVIIEYIHNSRTPYKATAEDVLYMHDRKVADDVILEWVRQSNALTPSAQSAPQGQTSARSPDLVTANTAPAPSVIEQQPQAVYQTQPTVVPSVTYAYPSYVYSGYYWPPVYLGFSYGFGGPFCNTFVGHFDGHGHGFVGHSHGFDGHSHGFVSHGGGFHGGFSGGGHFGGGMGHGGGGHGGGHR